MAQRYKQQLISGALVVLLFASSVQAQSGGSRPQAQTGDWQTVQNLQPGTRLTVKGRKTYSCFFEHATADELICEGRRPFAIRRPLSFTIPRTEIREIRVKPSQSKHGCIGAVAGAAVGAAVGASRAKGPRGAGAVIGAPAGALVGGMVGLTIAIFRRGKVIYKP